MDVFISYRRLGGGDFCGRLFDRFIGGNYSAFYDKESLKSGKFNAQIYKKIEKCNNFIIILPKNGLDRCVNDEDWVRKEIRKAIELEKNIIPVFLKDFEFPEALPEDISAIKDYQGIIYDSTVSRFDEMFNVLTSHLVDENGKSLLVARRQGASNTYYEQNGMSEREKNRIKSDRESCREIEDGIFRELLGERENFVIFNPAVYEISCAMDKYKPFNYSHVFGFLCNQKEADAANEMYGANNGHFYAGNMEDDDFESKMDKIIADNNIYGFDFVDLTLILKDSKNPAKKLRAIAERLNEGAIIYIRELDDGIVLCNPDHQSLFGKMLQIIKQDKYAGSRNFGRQVYTLLKNLDASEVKMVNTFLTTANMKMKKRKCLFDTYFSYVEPEYEDLLKEDPDNDIYIENHQWLVENYEKLEQAFLVKDFFFTAGFMFFYAKFDELD